MLLDLNMQVVGQAADWTWRQIAGGRIGQDSPKWRSSLIQEDAIQDSERENRVMFQVGDTVIHPGYGAGTVVDIEKLQCLGSDKPYYSIELSDEAKTRVWVPVRGAGKKGVRYPTLRSQLGQIWRVLRAGPETLSPDYKERNASLQEKLRGGDILRVAEVVRDMFWKDHRSRRLTITGKELYDKGLMLLTSEVATVQGYDLASAKAEISNILGASLAAEPAV